MLVQQQFVIVWRRLGLLVQQQQQQQQFVQQPEFEQQFVERAAAAGAVLPVVHPDRRLGSVQHDLMLLEIQRRSGALV